MNIKEIKTFTQRPIRSTNKKIMLFKNRSTEKKELSKSFMVLGTRGKLVILVPRELDKIILRCKNRIKCHSENGK